jgi:hypothetical protein
MTRKRLIAATLLAWAGVAFAGILDDTEDLKGKVVVAAGDVEELRCPSYGRYDCNRWPDNLLRFRSDDVCIISDLTACNLSCSGLLAVGREGTPYFFAFERFGSGMKKHSAERIECPSLY